MNSFKEKMFYIEPPTLSDEVSKDEVLEAWMKWQKENAKARANHKRQHTMAQDHGEIVLKARPSLIKQDGVWKQSSPMCVSGTEESYVLDLIEPATQDKYINIRGKRAGKPKRKHKRKANRDKKRNKILKEQDCE